MNRSSEGARGVGLAAVLLVAVVAPSQPPVEAAVLRGTVVGVEGDAQPKVALTLWVRKLPAPCPGALYDMWRLGETRVRATGEFAFAVSPGVEYLLEAHSDAGVAYETVVADGRDKVVELEPPATVKILVTNRRGEPVQGARIELAHTYGLFGRVSATGEDGWCKFSELPSGSYECLIVPLDQAAVKSDLLVKSGSIVEQRVGVDASTPLELFVLDESGAPVRGAALTRPGLPWTKCCGESGECLLRCLGQPFPREIIAIDPAGRLGARSTIVEPGAKTVSIVLPVGSSLVGSFGGNGRGRGLEVSAALVFATSERNILPAWLPVVVDTNARFRVTGIDPNAQMMLVSSLGGEFPSIVAIPRLDPGEETDMGEVPLSAAHTLVRGQYPQLRDGQTTATSVVLLGTPKMLHGWIDAQGRGLYESLRWSLSSRYQPVEASGAWSIPGVAPGEYTLTWRDAEFGSLGSRVVVVTGSDFQQRVE